MGAARRTRVGGRRQTPGGCATTFERLRAECDTSAANLEDGVTQLKQMVLARVRELERAATEMRQLRRELKDKSATIDVLEQAKSDLELWKARHLLELRRKDEELGANAEALATAEQTIAILRGLVDPHDRSRRPTPGRMPH